MLRENGNGKNHSVAEVIEFIERMKIVKANGGPEAEVRLIRHTCDEGFLPFAESQIPFIDEKNLDEAGSHILSLHRDAFTLRKECDNLLRPDGLKNSNEQKQRENIFDLFEDLKARMENICALRCPELIEAVDAVL